jgi:hypothetical protein
MQKLINKAWESVKDGDSPVKKGNKRGMKKSESEGNFYNTPKPLKMDQSPPG